MHGIPPAEHVLEALASHPTPGHSPGFGGGNTRAPFPAPFPSLNHSLPVAFPLLNISPATCTSLPSRTPSSRTSVRESRPPSIPMKTLAPHPDSPPARA
eukprot:scaffold187079_cov30-Tisochrysis_lutea.AAC.1